MSGLLGSISSGVHLASGIGVSVRNLNRLLSGAAFGGPQGVQLGAVNLTSFEVPASVNFGGAQLVEVHKLGGGVKQIDCMGPDDDAMAWQATILGPNATARARAIDAIRQAGLTVPLSWADFDFDVIVTRFRANYQRAALIPYEIECVVLADYGSNATDGPLGGLGGILGSVGGAIGEAAAEVGSVVATVQAGVSAVASVVTPITSALGISVPYLGIVQSGLSQAAGLAGSVGSSAAGVAGLAGDLNTVGTLSAMGAQQSGATLAQATPATPLDQVAATAGAQAGFVFGGQSAWGSSNALAAGGTTDLLGQSIGAAPAPGSPEDTYAMIKGTIPPEDAAGQIVLTQNGYNYTFNGGVLTGQAKAP